VFEKENKFQSPGRHCRPSQASTAAPHVFLLFSAADCLCGMYQSGLLSGARYADVFNDYLDLLNGLAFAKSMVKWKLHSCASVSNYALWEDHMHQGLHRCDTYERLDSSTCLTLVVRRVYEEIYNWWNAEMCEKGINSATWYDFQKFLRACIL
jgi:hypothetical protein